MIKSRKGIWEIAATVPSAVLFIPQIYGNVCTASVMTRSQ